MNLSLSFRQGADVCSFSESLVQLCMRRDSTSFLQDSTSQDQHVHVGMQSMLERCSAVKNWPRTPPRAHEEVVHLVPASHDNLLVTVAFRESPRTDGELRLRMGVTGQNLSVSNVARTRCAMGTLHLIHCYYDRGVGDVDNSIEGGTRRVELHGVVEEAVDSGA